MLIKTPALGNSEAGYKAPSLWRQTELGLDPDLVPCLLCVPGQITASL